MDDRFFYLPQELKSDIPITPYLFSPRLANLSFTFVLIGSQSHKRTAETDKFNGSTLPAAALGD